MSSGTRTEYSKNNHFQSNDLSVLLQQGPAGHCPLSGRTLDPSLNLGGLCLLHPQNHVLSKQLLKCFPIQKSGPQDVHVLPPKDKPHLLAGGQARVRRCACALGAAVSSRPLWVPHPEPPGISSTLGLRPGEEGERLGAGSFQPSLGAQRW